MNDVRITPMDRHQDFAEWLNELLEKESGYDGSPSGFEDHYIGLTSELGDWVGGLRFYVRGGVAHLLDLVVAESHRGQGHAHRMLEAFEARAHEEGADLAEFWTDDERAEAFLSAIGWERVVRRPRYMFGRTWTLMEKPLHD